MENAVSLNCLAAEDVYLDECVTLRRPYEIDEAVLNLRKDLGRFWDAVRYFANSDLPNSYFLQQFLPTYSEPFTQKKYWHGFAVVLAYRGIEKLDDVKEKLFHWFKDANWPGNFVIKSFIFKHKDSLKSCFVNIVWDAFYEGDFPWFWYLVNTFIEFYSLNSNELNALVDEIFNNDGLQENWNANKSRFEPILSKFFPKDNYSKNKHGN